MTYVDLDRGSSLERPGSPCSGASSSPCSWHQEQGHQARDRCEKAVVCVVRRCSRPIPASWPVFIEDEDHMYDGWEVEQQALPAVPQVKPEAKSCRSRHVTRNRLASPDQLHAGLDGIERPSSPFRPLRAHARATAALPWTTAQRSAHLRQSTTTCTRIMTTGGGEKERLPPGDGVLERGARDQLPAPRAPIWARHRSQPGASALPS